MGAMKMPLQIVSITKLSSNNSVKLINTPYKISMEPTNHPFRKENDLPNLHGSVPTVNLQRCGSDNKWCWTTISAALSLG